MRLALAAAVLALAAPAHVPAHAPHAHAKGKPPAPSVTLTAHIVSGNRQIGTAYADCCKSQYVTEFPKPLVVRMEGRPVKGGPPRVYFRCETPHCALASTDQPDEGTFVERTDETTYKAQIVKGVASIRIATEAAQPTGTYVVTATAHAYHREHVVVARFTLTSR
jgi:hypothetical protein